MGCSLELRPISGSYDQPLLVAGRIVLPSTCTATVHGAADVLPEAAVPVPFSSSSARLGGLSHAFQAAYIAATARLKPIQRT